MLKKKIVYSLREYLEISERGFQPITTTQNPQKPHLMCWIYDKTPELVVALDEIIGGGRT